MLQLLFVLFKYQIISSKKYSSVFSKLSFDTNGEGEVEMVMSSVDIVMLSVDPDHVLAEG